MLCIAQMALIGVSSGYSAISFPFILAAIYLIQKMYLRTSRQLRFLDLEAKSPLYSQFMECLQGLATVRAFRWQNAMETKHRELLDQSQNPFYLLFAVQRWLTLVLDLIVATVVCANVLIGLPLGIVLVFRQLLTLVIPGCHSYCLGCRIPWKFEPRLRWRGSAQRHYVQSNNSTITHILDESRNTYWKYCKDQKL